MSIYQELKGLKVKFLDSATSGDRAIEGEVFYNSAGPNISAHIAVGAWSAGSNLNQGRKYTAGFGSQTAGLIVGGNNTGTANCELYNGAGWSEVANLNTARGRHGSSMASPQTAGIIFGGTDPGAPARYAITESWDGSSWTETGDLPGASGHIAGAGTSTAALGFMGDGGPGSTVSTFEFGGSSWTAGGNMNAARTTGKGCGTQTAALATGGDNTGSNPYSSNLVEEYNGTSWTAVTAAPFVTAKQYCAGIQTDAHISNESDTSTALYDGTNWTASGAYGTARYGVGSNGQAAVSSNGSLMAGGVGPDPGLVITEEFNVSILTTTAAAWASGGNLNTGRASVGGAGTQTAGLAFGGRIGPDASVQDHSEEYDGSSWTEGDNLPAGRAFHAGTGTQTAGLSFGGNDSTGANSNVTAEYGGSSWTTGGNLNTARRRFDGAGTQTACLGFGGYTDTSVNNSEEYNGTSWTEGDNLNTARQYLAGMGSQTAGLAVGGNDGTALVSVVEEYDGTSYSEVNNIPTATATHGTSGLVNTAALIFGGQAPGNITTTLGYDGTNWSTRPSLAAARKQIGSAGNSGTSALAFGGVNPPSTSNLTATEEFTGDTTAASAKTIDFD